MLPAGIRARQAAARQALVRPGSRECSGDCRKTTPTNASTSAGFPADGRACSARHAICKPAAQPSVFASSASTAAGASDHPRQAWRSRLVSDDENRRSVCLISSISPRPRRSASGIDGSWRVSTSRWTWGGIRFRRKSREGASAGAVNQVKIVQHQQDGHGRLGQAVEEQDQRNSRSGVWAVSSNSRIPWVSAAFLAVNAAQT